MCLQLNVVDAQSLNAQRSTPEGPYEKLMSMACLPTAVSGPSVTHIMAMEETPDAVAVTAVVLRLCRRTGCRRSFDDGR